MKKETILKEIRKEYRCPNCNKLMFKAKLWGNYSIEFLCPRCKNKVLMSKNLAQK